MDTTRLQYDGKKSQTQFTEWLDHNGFSKYADAFEAHDINFNNLIECDTDGLKEIGIHPIGDRIRVMKKIRHFWDSLKKENYANASDDEKSFLIDAIKKFQINELENLSSEKKNTNDSIVTFISPEGKYLKVNVTGCFNAESIKSNALLAFALKGVPADYQIYIVTSTGSRIVSEHEIVAICHSSSRQERHRLMLCHSGEFPTSTQYTISRQISRQLIEIENNLMPSNLEKENSSKLNSISTLIGNSQKEENKSSLNNRMKRIRNFFGQRPPSELISSNLAEYFPGQDSKVLEKTVYNSVRWSMRMSSEQSNRFSVGSNLSTLTSSTVGHAWINASSRPASIALQRLSSNLSIPPRDSIFVKTDDTISLNSDATIDNTNIFMEKIEGEDLENDNLLFLEGERDLTRWIKGALIGSGSFGSVVLGMNVLTGELMAVKQVCLPTGEFQGEKKKQNLLVALEREIDLLRDLHHENIVQYLGSSRDTEYLNIFLEYVPGGSVATLLNNYGAFEEPLIRNFVRQILHGLKYLHEKDIIHRDIKGANILVDNKGGVKISDFGISKKVETGLLSGANHRPSLQGSVFWMAPEVVKQISYTMKADIWSVGCLVVEMFTGTHPFPEFSQMQAIFKIGSCASPAIPDESSVAAKNFLLKTFETDYHKRPSAVELLSHEFLNPTIGGRS